MNARVSLVSIVLTALFVVVAAAGEDADIEKVEKIERTLHFASPTGEKQVVVDNMFGSVTVTGYAGGEVKMSAQKVITAKSTAKIAEAQEKIVLVFTEENNLVRLYVDGPFRNHDDESVKWRGFKKEGYKVVYNFDLKLPRDCSIEIKTVSEGEITISNVAGAFDINNINGGIAMDKISGSGRAYALNGDLKLDFVQNPTEDCYFGTLNGEVKIYFLSPLSADFQMKTFNGDFFTDFPVSYLPRVPQVEKEENGKRVYKVGGTMGVRAGNGGPEISLDGFNGDMYLLKK